MQRVYRLGGEYRAKGGYYPLWPLLLYMVLNLKAKGHRRGASKSNEKNISYIKRRPRNMHHLYTNCVFMQNNGKI